MRANELEKSKKCKKLEAGAKNQGIEFITQFELIICNFTCNQWENKKYYVWQG